MRRIVATGVLAAMLAGLSGCGGDADEGMPKDVTPAKSIAISPTDTAKMKTKGQTKSATP